MTSAAVLPSLVRVADERAAVRRDFSLIGAIVAVTVLALAGGFFASRELAERVTKAHALDIAQEFTRALAEALGVFDPGGRYVGIVDGEKEAVFRFAQRVVHIDRMVAISPDRTVAFDSEGTKTGKPHRDKPAIGAAFERGETTVGFAEAEDTERQYVAETYVPVRAGQRVVGVFELYLDVTEYMASVGMVFLLAYATFAAAVVLATVVAVLLVYRSLQNRLAALRQMRSLRDDAEAARRQVERSLDQQKRFTTNAAHELRTPLAVLRARLDSLPPSRDAVALARDADRMSRLVDQLLTVARLEARLVELEDGVDLVAVARDTVAALFPLALADGKSIELAIELDGPPHAVPVRGNAFVLEDALRNLIDNALRHTPVGGAVEVAVTADPPGLEVRDRGPGVPAALRPHLFEPFVQGQERRGSAGLGLAIVAETAGVHGGAVDVVDRPGGGSVFRLSLSHPTAPAERTTADAA
ncbi:MAG TPA: HAMP domain-containing sensor histidine kinase [Azospirillum sp.]|nr:HAMP domain-containing sensor histidine kinase [Azospirillum sp.]